jgi:hypothetical protein
VIGGLVEATNENMRNQLKCTTIAETTEYFDHIYHTIFSPKKVKNVYLRKIFI